MLAAEEGDGGSPRALAPATGGELLRGEETGGPVAVRGFEANVARLGERLAKVVGPKTVGWDGLRCSEVLLSREENP
jgi:hypothetical protein